jgi:DNA-directed RNA polymerase subunit beta
MEPKDREKQVFTANLMPARGSWLELEIDKKGKVFVRIDRKRKLPVTVLLRAMTYNPETDGAVEESEDDIARLDAEIAELFGNSLYLRNTIESDPRRRRRRRARSSSSSRSSARASRRRWTPRTR